MGPEKDQASAWCTPGHAVTMNKYRPGAIFTRLLGILGVDRAISFFLLGKGLSLVTLPVSLYLIGSFLSLEEQGFYYTFASLVGLSIFFELGLGVVITQFASHEYASLEWSSDGELKGPADSVARVISLLRKSLLWYASICVAMALLMILLVPLYIRHAQEASRVAFEAPWILLVVLFSINTFLIPVFAVIEGCGKVADIQKMRLMQVLVGIFIGWVLLVHDGKLFALAGEFLGSTLVMSFWLMRRYPGLVRQVMRYEPVSSGSVIDWRRDVLPMQARISVSWIAIYFANYFIVPLTFSVYSAEDAGRLGMSIRLSTIIFNLSMAWVNTKIPSYGTLIRQNNMAQLNSLALKVAWRSTSVGLVSTGLVVAALFILERLAPSYANRILPVDVVAVLCIGSVAQVLTAAIAGYLRAHKQEPLTAVIVYVSLASVAICTVFAHFFTINVTIYAYALVFVFLAVPSHLYILHVKHREWYGSR